MQPIIDDLVARGILLRAAEPEGLALAAAPEHVSIVDILDVVRDPAAIDAPALAAAADAGAAALRRRDAGVREALEHVNLRDLVGDPGSAPILARLPREAAR
jgi:DNA-binding IscR family transcriptional regulator